MIQDIELHSQSSDYMANLGTNVIAIADDVAPCAAASNPQEVIHRMQLLLNTVEEHGIQNHIEFGTDKCKLLPALEFTSLSVTSQGIQLITV